MGCATLQPGSRPHISSRISPLETHFNSEMRRQAKSQGRRF